MFHNKYTISTLQTLATQLYVLGSYIVQTMTDIFIAVFLHKLVVKFVHYNTVTILFHLTLSYTVCFITFTGKIMQFSFLVGSY